MPTPTAVSRMVTITSNAPRSSSSVNRARPRTAPLKERGLAMVGAHLAAWEDKSTADVLRSIILAIANKPSAMERVRVIYSTWSPASCPIRNGKVMPNGLGGWPRTGIQSYRQALAVHSEWRLLPLGDDHVPRRATGHHRPGRGGCCSADDGTPMSCPPSAGRRPVGSSPTRSPSGRLLILGLRQPYTFGLYEIYSERLLRHS
jgi:hypothetical protein